MLKMILKDLRLSPLRSILTSISMLVGIIAMIASVLVGTLGKEYLISVNAQVYGWTPTYAFVACHPPNTQTAQDSPSSKGHNLSNISVSYSSSFDFCHHRLHRLLTD